MIYITYKYCNFTETNSVKNIWETNLNCAEELYKKFILQKAKDDFNIEINPHWFNIMDFKIHNSHLTEQSYKDKRKKWRAFLKEWDFDKYLEVKMNAKKLEFKNIYL